ncbi:uncharacterized protein TrAFT101_001328 [Trichoderma asperellum]|uniref:uncharacterized protein n=1 Tax=Trichoderma asperellum TaxID=101201 RepID=UPI003318C6C3|nr:hypothetical protein TrAFT101_001328 [Trichoderma asperellum]
MAPQDSFIEEEEDVCPLCIEEFDLSDRNFRPCPCGYQVCQFCFNNIKNNMNGLCPACRRPYDEKTIQWKVVTTEEVAEFRANIQKNQRKRVQEQRQKEAQKREAEKENRKNLIGVRVVQKNLVYITGLAPTVREDELLKTLRKPEFFGQYGAIQKISISNRKSSDGQHHSLGIYVTFEKPEEATRCIQAVHGSQNGDRILKAQYGTTKYCSAWLKNEKCNNPGCMFLHEQGDEEDSYTRQDLSSMNGIHTQRPLPSGNNGSFRTTPRQQVSQPTLTPVSQSMARSSSKDGSDYGLDGSALPSSANWARNPQRSRRGSHATSGAPSSPAVSASLPTTTEAAQEVVEDTETSSPSSRPLEDDKASNKDLTEEPQEQPPKSSLATILRALQSCTFSSFVTPQANELEPPLFDIRGGEKRKAMREDDDARISGDQKNAAEGQGHSESEAETGGSLALGGEPEERDMAGDGQAFEHRHINTFPPIQRSNADTLFGPALSGSNFNPGANQMGRGITPQQLMSLRPQSGFGEQVPSGLSGQTTFQNQAATNLKFTANPRVMGQQSSMIPASLQSSNNSHFFGSSMPAPPPGLKSTNTPPNIFGQGFGGSAFGTATKDSSGDLLQSLIGRSRGGGNQPHDGGKHHEFQLSDEAKLSVDALVADDSLPAVANAEPRLHQTSYSSISDVPIPNNIQIQGQPPSSQVPLATSYVPSLVSVNDPVLSKKTALKSNVLNQGIDLRTKANAAKDSLPAAMLGSWPALTKGPILEDKDFPALGAPKANEALGANASSISTKAATLKAIPGAKKHDENFPESPQQNQRDGVNTEEFQPMKGSQTKFLAQTTQSSGLTSVQPREEAERSDDSAEVSRFPPLPTPSAAGSATVTASRGMPKTLRVVPSSIKTEIRSASPSPAPIPSVVSATGKPGNSHRPGTPASEMISDTASITSVSVSISRAGSPPLGKIGTAPVRGTTKSQQRKQRKDVLKQETKILAETPKAETAEHAPVIGRKKKQKKEKPPRETNASSSAATPIEPPREEIIPQSKGNGKQITDDNHRGDTKMEGTRYSHGGVSNNGSSEKEVQETPTALPTSSIPETSESADKALERPQSSPASVFADIKESLWTAAIDKLQLLKPVSSNSSRPENNASNPSGKKDDCKECSCRCGEMQDADLAALRAGRPVRKQFHTDGSRMLITPHGDCIRGLTPEEEDTFLALQTAIAATAENPAAFVAPRHQPSSGAFSLIKGRAVPNGRPNIFPSTVQPQSQDPIGKLQREDALSYINQYVLPRLSLGATSMGFPKGASSTRDSASLNSLAPYFYGPDAAAGVGIYSTPESARAIQDFAAPGMSLDEISKGAAASSIGNMPLMSVEDAEAALIAAKRETEKLEKGLNLVIKRNRRLLLGA